MQWRPPLSGVAAVRLTCSTLISGASVFRQMQLHGDRNQRLGMLQKTLIHTAGNEFGGGNSRHGCFSDLIHHTGGSISAGGGTLPGRGGPRSFRILHRCEPPPVQSQHIAMHAMMARTVSNSRRQVPLQASAVIVVVAILTYFIFFMLPYVHSHSIPEGGSALTGIDFDDSLPSKPSLYIMYNKSGEQLHFSPYFGSVCYSMPLSINSDQGICITACQHF